MGIIRKSFREGIQQTVSKPEHQTEIQEGSIKGKSLLGTNWVNWNRPCANIKGRDQYKK
jgi:hypothetical protein